MKYKVVLHESEEGIAVSCPALPGCWSQGETEAEAIENIQDAIQEYLAAVEEMVKGNFGKLRLCHSNGQRHARCELDKR